MVNARYQLAKSAAEAVVGDHQEFLVADDAAMSLRILHHLPDRANLAVQLEGGQFTVNIGDHTYFDEDIEDPEGAALEVGHLVLTVLQGHLKETAWRHNDAVVVSSIKSTETGFGSWTRRSLRPKFLCTKSSRWFEPYVP